MKKRDLLFLIGLAILFSLFYLVYAQPAHCTNKQWDKTLGEEGVDCGGVCPFPCPPSTPTTPPACRNGIKDANEAGVDCGGVCPIPCPPSTPTTPPACRNGIKDANEAGVDCGGVCPIPCPPSTPTTPPACRNGIKDANEAGVDCGGVCPIPCPPSTPTKLTEPQPAGGSGGGSGGGGGRRHLPPQCPPPRCVFKWLCDEWGPCVDGVQKRGCRNVGTCPNDCETIALKIPKTTQPCQKDGKEPASCFDGVRNQDESDVDCGGVCIAQKQKCKEGQLCAGKQENCFSEFCSSDGRCNKKQTCFDGVQNQGELGVDCSGPCPACLACSDGLQNGGELGIDCGGSCPNKNCCTNNYRDSGETDIDCGGQCKAEGKRCDVFQACKIDDDCKEGSCQQGLCARAAAIEQPLSLSAWSLLLAILMPFWWIIVLALLLITGALIGYHYYEQKKTEEQLPPPPIPSPSAVSAEIPQSEIQPEFSSTVPEGELMLPEFPDKQEITPPAIPVLLPSSITVQEAPPRPKHYREIPLPLYVDKEQYKKIMADLPFLTSGLLKKNTEIYQDLFDIFSHKNTDHRKLRDAAETISKQLMFLDVFLFERGKKRYKIKLEE